MSGRVLLAGDAAHIHPPAGAQGLNVGLQDAFNLGWKLAAAVQGWAPEGLLESYHQERHCAGAEVLMNAQSQVALSQQSPHAEALRTLLADLAGLEPVRRRLAELVTGTGIRYSSGANEHSLLGRLMPNLALETDEGPVSVARLLTPGKGLLLSFAEALEADFPVGAWKDRVDFVRANSADSRGLDAVLVRPDGHIAWLAPTGGTSARGTVRQALEQWFGVPSE